MIGKHTAATPAAQDAATAPTVPDDLAGAAEQLRAEAEAARGRAFEAITEAERRLTAAHLEAAQLVETAQGEAHDLNTEARAASRQADGLEQRAAWLDNAVAEQARTGQADQRVSALETERDQQAEVVAQTTARLAQLTDQRSDVEEQLAAAREAGNVEAITDLRGRLGGIDDLAATLTSQRATAQDRLGQLGDGEHRGELAEARRAAAASRAAASRILRDVFPDSAEAVEWRAREEFRLTIAAQRERLADEAGAGQPRQRRIQL